MIRLAVALWLVRHLDGLLADDRFAGRWHFVWGVVAIGTALGAAAEATYHFWGWSRHHDALRGEGPAPCRH